MSQHKLFGLRGQTFAQKYSELHAKYFEQIKDDFLAIKNKTGKFTPTNLGELCNKYLLPVKTVCEWLEHSSLLPCGTWERMQDRGCKAKDLGVVWGDSNGGTNK